MNRWVAIGISAVTLVAAVALYFTGHMVPAAIAFVTMYAAMWPPQRRGFGTS